MNLLSRHAAFIGFLFIYAAVLALQIDHGLASGDGHGIVHSVQTLLDNGRIDVSRPPGHPTTEFYVFGGIGWILLRVFETEFSDKIYLTLQAFAALAGLGVFYELALRTGVGRARSLLATICLACSAQFLFNALDGEEFNYGLLFILISLRLLLAPPSLWRWCLSIFCFALATGCRPELVFAAITFPIYSLCDSKLGWKWALLGLAVLIVAMAIVWLPILSIGIREPYTAGMSLRDSILGGVYRIIFQAFTPLVFLLLGWTLIVALLGFREQFQARNFIFLISCALPLIFLAVFFLHPSKAAHLLVAVPFLLILTAGRSIGLLLAISLFTVLSCFVNVDIFKDRQLVRPYFTIGSYVHTIGEKPRSKLDYLRKLSAQCEDHPAAIIGNAWPWDFEYHIERNSFAAREQDLHGEIKHDLPAFFARGDHCIFLSPEAAFETNLLKEWQQKGYVVKMDATLYRTLFARYDVHSSLSSGTVDTNGVSLNLFRGD